MLEIKVGVNIEPAMKALDQMAEDIHSAWDLAVREVTMAAVFPSIQAAVLTAFPLGTGRTVSQLHSKFWFNKKTGLTSSSVRVRGDRAFVMHIQEFGAKHLPARNVFGDAWRAMQAAVETAFVQAFERHLAIKLKASGF